MKLRRPRLKSVIGWASALAGALFVGAAVVSHLEATFGPLRVNSLSYGDGGLVLLHSKMFHIVRKDGAHTSALRTRTIESERVPGARLRLTASADGAIWVFKPSKPSPAIYKGIRQRIALFTSSNRWWLEASPGTTAYILDLHAAWLWAIGAPMLFIPMAWRVRSLLRSQRRRRVGLCKTCGYDVAGLPGGLACPECGAGHGPTGLSLHTR